MNNLKIGHASLLQFVKVKANYAEKIMLISVSRPDSSTVRVFVNYSIKIKIEARLSPHQIYYGPICFQVK